MDDEIALLLSAKEPLMASSAAWRRIKGLQFDKAANWHSTMMNVPLPVPFPPEEHLHLTPPDTFRTCRAPHWARIGDYSSKFFTLRSFASWATIRVTLLLPQPQL